MELNKKISLKGIFFRYFFSIATIFILVTFLIGGLFMLGIKNEFILPANRVEYAIKESKEQIASSKPFNSNLIPKGAKYIFLSKDKEIIESNMNETEIKNSFSYLKDKNPNSYEGYYISINRDDGLCLIHYYLKASFSIDLMNKYLPSIEILFIIIYIIAIFLSIVAISYLFAKKLNNQLLPILNAAEKISDQNLDFKVGKSNIKELNHILNAISDMKDALKESLTKQWRDEQLKKEQISALAHDIKTPLTIIRVNVEFLKSSNLNKKDMEYVDYAINSVDRIENYLKLLIDLTRMDAQYKADIIKISSEKFISRLIREIRDLIKIKDLKLETDISDLPENLYIDKELILRAIINIVSNALDYSKKGDKINLNIFSSKEKISFTIIDQGVGFSPEDLKNAQNNFYKGDKSRNSGSHYGIGLYIVKRIAEIHKGNLILENCPETGGGKVSLEINLNNLS